MVLKIDPENSEFSRLTSFATGRTHGREDARHTHDLHLPVGRRFRARVARLDECVAALPEEYRDAIHLCYRNEMPVARVAREVGASVEAVKKRLQRARAMIAACMDQGGAIA